MNKISTYRVNLFIIATFFLFLIFFFLNSTPYMGIVFAATPTPSPPGISNSPNPQAGGSSITFTLTCSDPGNNVRGYICKASDCSSCVYGTYSNCWCYDVTGVASNPSCTYTLPSCCSGITVGSNNYYGRCQSTEPTYQPYTSVASGTFTCKKENICSCSSGECYNECKNDPDTVGAWCCNSNQCSHDGACYTNLVELSSTGSSAACLLGETIAHNTQGTTNYRYATYDGQLYYCGTDNNDKSPYSDVTNLIPGDKIGLCQCNTDGTWNCAGVIKMRGGRIKIV
jgi:hypothetical protein